MPKMALRGVRSSWLHIRQEFIFEAGGSFECLVCLSQVRLGLFAVSNVITYAQVGDDATVFYPTGEPPGKCAIARFHFCA